MISHEMTDVHRELLTDGLMDAVLDQNPQVEALRAVQLLLHYNRRVPDSEVQLETPVTNLSAGEPSAGVRRFLEGNPPPPNLGEGWGGGSERR